MKIRYGKNERNWAAVKNLAIVTRKFGGRTVQSGGSHNH